MSALVIYPRQFAAAPQAPEPGPIDWMQIVANAPPERSTMERDSEAEFSFVGLMTSAIVCGAFFVGTGALLIRLAAGQ